MQYIQAYQICGSLLAYASIKFPLKYKPVKVEDKQEIRSVEHTEGGCREDAQRSPAHPKRPAVFPSGGSRNCWYGDDVSCLLPPPFCLFPAPHPSSPARYGGAL